MQPPLLILIFGHNASGKSTLCKEIESKFDISRVGADMVRDLVINNIKYYADTHYSYPSDKINSANKVISRFQKELIAELLSQKQSVLVDGAGITKDKRKEYIDLKKFASGSIKTIIIEVILDESDLLERLKERDQQNKQHKWVDFYKDVRKEKYQPAESGEADFILKYNQTNAQEIIQAITNIQNEESISI